MKKDKFLFGAWSQEAPRLWKYLYKNKHWKNRKPKGKWFSNVIRPPVLDALGEGIPLPSADQRERISNLSAVFDYCARCYKSRVRFSYCVLIPSNMRSNDT